jgi:hypothetical protein
MLGIERDGGGLDFQIVEPGLGPTIVYITQSQRPSPGSVCLDPASGTGGDRFYLARGGNPRYSECLYYGCPERIRACYLLSLNEAVPALGRITDGDPLARPLHWMSQASVFDWAWRRGARDAPPDSRGI